MTFILVTLLAATLPADRCSADLARAEASAFEATRVQHECMDPAECRVADELVTAAQAQLAAVRQLCSVPAPVVSVADPFEAAEADDSDAAWVVTSQVAEEFARAVLP
jgi:hypothetical protein